MERSKNKQKQRACIGCRAMKIKCVPVPKSSKCETCLRLVRPCESPGPMKPRMKPAQKFQELEKKIEILTSALQTEKTRSEQPESQIGLVDDYPARYGDFSRESQHFQAPVASYSDSEAGDIIDQGVMDVSTASNLLNYWTENIRPIFPILQFSAAEDIHILRKNKPVLFLTILTITSAVIEPTFLDRLLPQLNKVFAQEVFVLGNRSMDLLQSLIIFSQYHIQPRESKSFPLTQHVYNAIAMASDLMLEEKIKATAENPDETTLEACRLLLGIYFAASASSTLIRRSQFNLFQPLYQKYIMILMDPSRANPDDIWFCKLIELQQISEDASLSLNERFEVEADSFDDSKTRSLFGLLQHRLSEWDRDSSGPLDPRLRDIARFSIELLTNQVGIRGFNFKMGVEYRNSLQRRGSVQTPSITAAHFQALSRAVELCGSILNTYISLEMPLARSLPNIYFIWLMYAGVCLAKLSPFIERFTFNQSGESEGGNKSFIPDQLDAVHHRLSVLSQNEYLPQARPFETVFRKLSTWYVQRQAFCINLHRGCMEPAGPVHDIVSGETLDQPGPRTSTQLPLNPPAPANSMEDRNGQHHINQYMEAEDDTDMMPEASGSQAISNASVDNTFGNAGAGPSDAASFSAEEMKDFDMSMMYNNYFWMLPFLR